MTQGNKLYKELKHAVEEKGNRFDIVTACEELEVNEDLRLRMIEILEGE